jgi:hypothetical protein
MLTALGQVLRPAAAALTWGPQRLYWLLCVGLHEGPSRVD